MKKITLTVIAFAIIFGVQLLIPNQSEAGVSCKYDFYGNYVCRETGFNSGGNSSSTRKDFYGNEFNVCNIETLFEMKKSHRMIRKNFSKTMKDFYRLKDIIGDIEETKFIYERLIEMVLEANNELWGFDVSSIVEEARTVTNPPDSSLNLPNL